MAKVNFHLRNITDGLKATDIHWVYRNGSIVPIKGLSIDSLSFGATSLTLNKNFIVNGYIDTEHLSGNIYESTTTETVDVTGYTNIHVTTSGVTLSLTGMLSDSFTTIKNISGGDIYLNFNILFAGETVTAPITMPSGDSYPLVYDLTNTRFVL